MDYVFFWGGEYSNWYPSLFYSDIEVSPTGLVTGLRRQYNCVEQYMMAQKAILFNDLDSLTKIMQTQSPRKQKALGRKIKNFDMSLWDKVKYEVVLHGNYRKYNSYPNLKEMLLSTQGKVLVEASPHDRIWGIGFDEANALENKDKWGENLLGKVLMEVRDNLIAMEVNKLIFPPGIVNHAKF
jgi:ribA/ribD-fused uncharacterized protein